MTFASFPRPDLAVRKNNESLVNLVLIQAEVERDMESGWGQGEIEPEDSYPPHRSSYKKHRELADHLLSLDTGPWGADTITHHCKGVLCCRGGIEDTKKKLWCAVLVAWFLNCIVSWRFG